jgi:hypothetical protein
MSVTFFAGKGDGTFRAGVGYVTAVKPITVVTGDFNRDGRLDAACGAGSRSVTVLINHGCR